MASVQVPKKHLKGLEKFLRFSEDDFNLFIGRIAETPITLNTAKVISDAVASVDDIPLDEAQIIRDALLSLSLAKATSEDDGFVSELVQAIGETTDLAILLDKVGAETLKSRLENFFNVASLSLATKASSLMYEYENVYYRGRTLTDVRPVFSADIDTVEAALIIHSLRIHYHVGGAHKDFYVALDTEDVQQLINILERAKVKAEKLKAMLTKSGTPYLESD